MALIHNSSLSKTIDAINDAHFWNKTIGAADRRSVSRWLASRHGQPHSYADTFALFASERSNGWKLFTGERVQSAAARHIAGEEACRALLLLNVAGPTSNAALARATSNLLQCLSKSESDTEHRMGGNCGIFCCGACTVSIWRHILAGGLDRHEERLRAGTRKLKTMRDKSDGGWRRFPLWYTISALIEIDLPEARAELQYIAPSLERAAKRSSGGSIYAKRRAELARRALHRI